jgi:hypothetical protein
MRDALMAIYNTVEFCIKCSPMEVTQPVSSYLGVKQGCIPSPLLFVLYIIDIVSLNNIDDDTPRIGKNSEILVPGLLYADDCLLCSLSVAGLQRALNNLAIYSDIADLRVHTGKTTDIL